MTRSSTAVFDPLISRSTGRVPRGELWLGADLFAKAGLEDNLDGRFRMVDRLGQDIVSLSISDTARLDRSTGYRYFSVTALKPAHANGHALLAVVDGPFQRIVSENGLINTLTRWYRAQQEFAEAFRKAYVHVTDLVQRCLEHSIAAVVIADDLAGEHYAIANPKDIQSVFLPFYTRLTSLIHQADARALFHSCGDIRALVPMIASAGFDGLAAIQYRTNDLESIMEQYRTLSILIAGIDADILEADTIGVFAREGFRQRVRALCALDRFVLGSCCGLYSGKFLERIQQLYRLADPID